MGIKFKVVNVVDLVKLQSAKENNEALSDEEFAELFTEDKPVLFAYHSYARDVRGLIYDRPNHDNFNVHGYEEQGSTTTPYDMVRVNNIDRYELQAEALRMIDATSTPTRSTRPRPSVRKPSSSLSTTATITRITPTGSTPVSTPTSRVLSPLPPQPLAITSEPRLFGLIA